MSFQEVSRRSDGMTLGFVGEPTFVPFGKAYGRTQLVMPLSAEALNVLPTDGAHPHVYALRYVTGTDVPYP